MRGKNRGRKKKQKEEERTETERRRERTNAIQAICALFSSSSIFERALERKGERCGSFVPSPALMEKLMSMISEAKSSDASKEKKRKK